MKHQSNENRVSSVIITTKKKHSQVVHQQILNLVTRLLNRPKEYSQKYRFSCNSGYGKLTSA